MHSKQTIQNKIDNQKFEQFQKVPTRSANKACSIKDVGTAGAH